MSDREAFEKWARDSGIRYQSKYSTGEYYFGDADLAWKAWQAAQAQAKPIAAVHGWFHGECVIRPLDPEAVLRAGMALYSQPQAQAVNQQLLELETYDAGYLNDFGGGNVSWWHDYIRSELGRAHDFYSSQIAAAQEQSK